MSRLWNGCGKTLFYSLSLIITRKGINFVHRRGITDSLIRRKLAV